MKRFHKPANVAAMALILASLACASTELPIQPPAVNQIVVTQIVVVTQAVMPQPSLFQVRVYANQGWQDSHAYIGQGSQIRIDVVAGQWTETVGTKPYNSGTGTGYTCSSFMPARRCGEARPDAPQGALVGQVGNSVFKISWGTHFAAQRSGHLFLRINDGDAGLCGNDRSLDVRITVLP